MNLPTGQFCSEVIHDISSLGNGLINDTFLVTTENTAFVLQRINTQVFPKPVQIMENLSLLTQHIKQKNSREVKLIIPAFLKSSDHQPYYLDSNNYYWRALEFIENTVSKEKITNKKQAEQVGFAVGHFHRLCSDANCDLFADTLPGFHITPQYFKQYQTLEDYQLKCIQSKKTQQCEQFIADFEPKINTLENARKQGLLIERLTHGDPKLNNFLFDTDTEQIVSLIDLDTVKPGLVHYDIADCLRSCCHNTQTNRFNFKICETILNSYLKQTAVFFTKHDYAFLYPAIELIPFELGLRFFTDYLQGNKYFKVDSAEQNLDRAWAQFQLCKSISEQEREIRRLIDQNR